MAVHGRLTNLDALKREIAEALAISTVAERLGVELQASGEQWRGLCPLHQEHTPSFYLNDAKGVYHCFGCKAGGDMIDLVQQVRHLDFVEAMHWLAAEADVDIDAYTRPLTDDERAVREFWDWCEAWLMYQPQSQTVSRVPEQTQWEFGVVVRDRAAAAGYLADKQYLCDGVILPWRAPNGRLVGWRVREHPGAPKSVFGTPNDFPLGRITEETLFGIQVAREHVESRHSIVLVEGEYDCMALHSHGIRNVAAMGGSSLTQGQMQLLQRLRIREVILVLDGDEAGQGAAKALAERYWAMDGVYVRVATCPAGADPESLVRNQGDWALQMLVASAPSALEYLLRLEWSTRDRGTLSSKLEFVSWIRDTYGAKLRSSEESLVLAEVAKWLEIPELEVRDFVRAASADALCAPDSERALIGRACQDQQYYVHLRSQMAREDFFVIKHQRIWDLLADMLIDGQEFDSITVSARAARYGIPDGYIEGCLQLAVRNLDWHLQQVVDLGLRRAARRDALTFKDQIADLNRSAEALIGDLTHHVTAKALGKNTLKQLSEQVDQAMDTLHERMRNPSEIHGLDLGAQYPRFSQTLQGLQPQRLVLVSAISGRGKSTMLITWAASLAVHQSIPVDLLSLEMGETEILWKLASHMTAIPTSQISGGRLSDQEAQAVERAMLRIRNSPLHIWTPDGLTGSEFLLYARESVMQRRTRAFFVDYVQLIDPDPGQERDNGYKLYGDFGRLAKMKVARSMEVAVVCCAQLRRAAADKERPTKEDMGDSYALVRHSDVIVILHGQEEASTMELWVDKNRQGPPNVLVPMEFTRSTSTWREVSGAPRHPEYLIHQ